MAKLTRLTRYEKKINCIWLDSTPKQSFTIKGNNIIEGTQETSSNAHPFRNKKKINKEVSKRLALKYTMGQICWRKL